MKKYKIQLNACAYRDLEEIFEYIANDLQSPEYAKGQTDRLWKSLKTLEIFPSPHQERLVGNYAGKGSSLAGDSKSGFSKYGSVRRNIGQRAETDDRGGSAAVWQSALTVLAGARNL